MLELPLIGHDEKKKGLAESLLLIYERRKEELTSLNSVLDRIEYFEEDEKASLMGNASSLKFIYFLNLAACACFMYIGWKMWRTPKNALLFINSL